MKGLKKKGLALVAGAIFSMNALAEAEFKLKLHHFLPPMSMAHKQILKPWAEKVEKESQGRIDIELYPAMQLGGRPPQLLDQVRKGIADISWTVGGYTPGRFPKATVFELPFMAASAKATSMALQEYADTEMQDELKDVHVLAMHTHAPGSLHSKDEAIASTDDLEGMRVRAPNKVMSGALKELGTNTVFMPVTEMPSAISKGILDVSVLPYEVVLPMKIYELVKHHTEFKGDRGLYTQFFIFSMNKDIYNAMPADLQRVIDQNSGLQLAGRIGQLFDEYEVYAREAAVKQGNSFSYVEGAEYDRWASQLAPVTDTWIEDMSDDGYEAKRLLKKAQDLISKYEDK